MLQGAGPSPVCSGDPGEMGDPAGTAVGAGLELWVGEAESPAEQQGPSEATRRLGPAWVL